MPRGYPKNKAPDEWMTVQELIATIDHALDRRLGGIPALDIKTEVATPRPTNNSTVAQKVSQVEDLVRQIENVAGRIESRTDLLVKAAITMFGYTPPPQDSPTGSSAVTYLGRLNDAMLAIDRELGRLNEVSEYLNDIVGAV